MPYVFSLLLLALSAVSFTVFSFGACADRSYQGTLYSYLFPDSGDTYMNFGVLTASRLNIEQLIFGKRSGGLPPDGPHTNPSNPFDTSGKNNSDSTGGGGNSSGGSDTDEPKPPVVYGDNVLEIDFDELISNESNASIKKLHEYFKNVTPTKKNEYTGMFEGKNLIFLTLEGFSGKVISKELTPTLYKMSTEGFVFNNYYCSVWAGSTLTGEYANLTGNMYMTTSCLKGKNSGNYQPFVLGNQFRSLGYKTMVTPTITPTDAKSGDRTSDMSITGSETGLRTSRTRTATSSTQSCGRNPTMRWQRSRSVSISTTSPSTSIT